MYKRGTPRKTDIITVKSLDKFHIPRSPPIKSSQPDPISAEHKQIKT